MTDTFDAVQQWLFEQLVQPMLFAAGLGNLLEDGYAATGWLLVGLVQIALMVTVLAALERWRPVEPVNDRAAVRVDVLYTLLHRLGLFRVLMFFSIGPLLDALSGSLRVAGVPTWQLDGIWPGVSDQPVVSFLLYLLVFDLAQYLIHRAQHRWDWWWALHAVHHSQRQMTMWTDNRNHLIDSMLTSTVLAFLARAIGVGPGQFVALVAVTQLMESLQHANLRLGFGRLGERLLISPRFHRHHHSIRAGHRGANFGVLFPVWDMLFGTAQFTREAERTGIADQLPEHGGRDYGRGFWAQQWLGVLRLTGRA